MFTSSYRNNRAREAQSRLEHLARSGDFNALLHYNLTEAHILQFETSPERTLRGNAFHNAAISARALISTFSELRAAATNQQQNRELDKLQEKLDTVRKSTAEYFSVHKSKNCKTVFEAISTFLGVETAIPARAGEVRSLFGGGRVVVGWKQQTGVPAHGAAGQQVPEQSPNGRLATQPPSTPVVGTPVQPVIGTPVQPVIGTPIQPVIGTPVQPVVGTPVQPVVGTPVRPVVGTPPLPAAGTSPPPAAGTSMPPATGAALPPAVGTPPPPSNLYPYPVMVAAPVIPTAQSTAVSAPVNVPQPSVTAPPLVKPPSAVPAPVAVPQPSATVAPPLIPPTQPTAVSAPVAIAPPSGIMTAPVPVPALPANRLSEEEEEVIDVPNPNPDDEEEVIDIPNPNPQPMIQTSAPSHDAAGVTPSGNVSNSIKA